MVYFLGGGGLNYINCFNEIKKKQQQQQQTKPIQNRERLLTTLLLCSELLVWGFSSFFPEIFVEGSRCLFFYHYFYLSV